MLDQVGIAALAIGLVQRAGVDDDPDRDLAGRHAVLAHRIAHAVAQLAEVPFPVLRHVAAAVEPGRARLRRRDLHGDRRGGDQEQRCKQGEAAGAAREKVHDKGIGSALLKDQ